MQPKDQRKKKKKKKKHRRNGYLEDYLSVKCWVDSLSGIEYVSKPRVGSSQIIIFTSVSFFFFCQCWSSLHLDCWYLNALYSLLGVLFALKVLNNHCCPGGFVNVLGFPVSNRFACWVELLAIHFISPGWVFTLRECKWRTWYSTEKEL